MNSNAYFFQRLNAKTDFVEDGSGETSFIAIQETDYGENQPSKITNCSYPGLSAIQYVRQIRNDSFKNLLDQSADHLVYTDSFCFRFEVADNAMTQYRLGNSLNIFNIR